MKTRHLLLGLLLLTGQGVIGQAAAAATLDCVSSKYLGQRGVRIELEDLEIRSVVLFEGGKPIPNTVLERSTTEPLNVGSRISLTVHCKDDYREFQVDLEKKSATRWSGTLFESLPDSETSYFLLSCEEN